MQIKIICAREVPDSRGSPTVEVFVSANGFSATASVPSGTSTGKNEAHYIVASKAVGNVNTVVAKKIRSVDITSLSEIDNILIRMAGRNKSALGANATLAVSIAFAKLLAKDSGMHLYEYVAKLLRTRASMPVPQILVAEGGRHANIPNDFQEFLIMPKAKKFSGAFSTGKAIYKILGKPSRKLGYEAAYIIRESIEKRLEMITKAIEESGYKADIALDCAASEFYKNGAYILEGRKYSPGGLMDFYKEMVEKYRIISMEDAFSEDDASSWKEFYKRFGKRIQIVGDDLLCTNPGLIQKAIRKKLCNAMILKPNQIGTVTESLDAARLAMKNGWNIVVSHRSRETQDDFIADLAVAIGRQCKFGAPARERMIKYNQLLRIEKQLL